MSGLTVALARHIATLGIDQIPAPARRASERSLLDAVGVMLGATALGEGCGPFADLAKSSPGPCTVLGRTFRAQPLQAVLANGALAHALDYEDALDGAPVHPNAAVVPVAMALAEADATISGADMITAIAAGCDLVCRLGLALERNPDEFGWYPPPILSTFGGAATAARLLHLDADRTAHAFALALAQATYSSEFKTWPDSTLRAVRDGFAAHNGLLAAVLAQQGVQGHLTAFEGKAGFFALFARGAYDPAVLTRQLGAKFHGEYVSFKPWPSCRGTHAFIEAALHLRGPAGGSDNIAAIDVSGAPLLTMLVEPSVQKQAPATAIDAKFSLPFCIAAALAKGEIALPTFFETGRRDAATLVLARRVRFTIDPAMTMKDAAGGTLTLHLTAGRVLHHAVGQAQGSPASPLADEKLIAKFADCASYARPGLGAGKAQQLALRLLDMSREPSAGAVFASLAG